MSWESGDGEQKARLIGLVKKEVKQLMEEAVTRKFVHEDSASITSLCAAIDACLLHGLRRRALGLFKTNSTTALLYKIGKTCEAAAHVSRRLHEIETMAGAGDGRRFSSSSDSVSIKSSLSRNSGSITPKRTANSTSTATTRYMWLRTALIEKQLAAIVVYLVRNYDQFYERDALIADAEYGNILSALLVGPCALDYTKMKTCDYFWSDPPADELMQRARISNMPYSSPNTPHVNRRPGLHFHAMRKPLSTEAISVSAREYVESLHQNNKTTLLYGKNNVVVQCGQQNMGQPGYLSLHQMPTCLMIKWTPNQLMNGCRSESSDGGSGGSAANSAASTSSSSSSSLGSDKSNSSAIWEDALRVRVDHIIYLHCHHQADSGGTLVLVAHDGVQYPPLLFPRGGHLLAFLSCLETGLLPHGQLDPPLWSQRGHNKVFPRLRRATRRRTRMMDNKSDNNAESDDYVFRVVFSKSPFPTVDSQELMYPSIVRSKPLSWLTNRPKLSSSTISSSSTSSAKSFSLSEMDSSQINDVFESKTSPTSQEPEPMGQSAGEKSPSIQSMCASMKRQIISRAFYGWLAHCRHLHTVRTHLSGLVSSNMVSAKEPSDVSGGVTGQLWDKWTADPSTVDVDQIMRYVYFGGVEPARRQQIWPFLLNHYDFHSTQQQRSQQDKELQHSYESTMSEWMAVEAIIHQRDKEVSLMHQQARSSHTNGHIGTLNEDTEPTSESDSRATRGNSTENDIQTPPPLTLSPVSTDDIVAPPTTSERKQQNNGNLDEINKRDKIDDIGQDTPQEHLHVEDVSPCHSPASSNGGIYSNELLDTFGLNIHRIDKDVQRCDRNHWFFISQENLETLRNIMCTYVWERLDIGYMQGMCDLVAPLLVILRDESLTYSCFCNLMDRMSGNFPQGGAMDQYFANMRSLIQVLDAEMFAHMQQNGDYTHFYFCYRWFLLDFKREFLYDDVFLLWETIWAANQLVSSQFVLFIALAMVEHYRDIILDNGMDFTDIIKFFNEMAERHNAKSVLDMSRDLTLQLQNLIDNK